MKQERDNLKPFNLTEEKSQLFWLSIICLVITVLDFTGALVKLPWLKEHIPAIILSFTALAFVVLSNLISNSRKKIVEDFTSLERNMIGIQVNEFENVGEAYLYIVDRLKEARKTIEDVTWGSYIGYRTTKEEEAYNKYLKAMEDVCKKGMVMYKEISNLSNIHYFNRAENLTKYYSYHLGYIDLTAIKVPLMSFIIIDSEEVMLGFKRVEGVSHPTNDIIYISVTEPNIVGFYVSYYNDLWKESDKVKESTKFNKKLLQEIKDKLID